MRIPLDYYRVLGVPIQATPEQLQQAYHDRAQQLPRYHYSQKAITARKQLLAAAYRTLSDPEQRQAYDQSLLAKTYTPDAQIETLAPAVSLETSNIEIQEAELSGALLLLQELGEYELVLELGRPYLRNGILDLKHQRLGSVLSEADIVLTVALAYLELGREQWQQGHYEGAAQSLQEGLELLLREGLFSEIQNEIRLDLHKLRPYRVLELLAHSEDQLSERHQGLLLLQNMLEARGGIEGTGNDQSGLSINDFLRFIQQLRIYLSVGEQQELFEQEARRPSAVAAYLAVYALVAKGFVQKQPSLIRRAKAMLSRLSAHQDVYLEQAVCALLIGQTQEATQALELTQEHESLVFIQEYSVNQPDLIPGLYLYTERWLQEEVFPYFRDLAHQKVDLKAYFADEQVQTYLEALATETIPVLEPQAETASSALAASTTPSSNLNSQGLLPLSNASQDRWQLSASFDPQQHHSSTSLAQAQIFETPSQHSTATLPAASGKSSVEGSGTSKTLPPTRTNRSRGKVANQPRVHKPARRPAQSTLRKQRQVKLFSLGLLSLFAVAAVAAIVVYLNRSDSPATAPVVSEQPLLELERPPLPIVTADTQQSGDSNLAQPVQRATTLDQDAVKQLIQTWQLTKAKALGPNHTGAQLSQILTEPALSEWRSRVQADKANNSYWQYKLNRLSVDTLRSVSPEQLNAAVTISETAQFFAANQLQKEASYTDTYQVQYQLVRENGQWRIKAMKVL